LEDPWGSDISLPVEFLGVPDVGCNTIGQMFWALIKPDQKNWVEKSPLIKFTINSSIGNTTGLAPFKINYGYMPTMMREMRMTEKTPPGVKMFT